MLKTQYRHTRSLGFSLLEVMISLIIISLGILGITGMLIKGMSNAKSANQRTIAALQASSLAASMYANRAFWAAPSPAVSFSTQWGASKPSITSSTNINFIDASSCDGAGKKCTPQQIAGADAQNWINSINSSLANGASNVSCTTRSDGAFMINNCDITLSWTEKFVDASNKISSSSSAATSGTRTYTLHVLP